MGGNALWNRWSPKTRNTFFVSRNETFSPLCIKDLIKEHLVFQTPLPSSPSLSTTIMLPFATLFLFVLLSFSLASPIHYVSRFQLLQLPSKRALHDLDNYSVITTSHPFAILALISGTRDPIKHVTFTDPWYTRMYYPPYALAGVSPKGKYLEANLSPGVYRITAYTGEYAYGHSAKKVLVQFRPDFDKAAPLPDFVDAGDFPEGELHIPKASFSCTRREQPDIPVVTISNDAYPDSIDVYVRPDWCHGPDDTVRIRTIQWTINQHGSVVTKAIAQKIGRHLKYGLLVHAPRYFSKDVYFFIEVCVRVEQADELGDWKPLCVKSNLRWLPKLAGASSPLSRVTA